MLKTTSKRHVPREPNDDAKNFKIFFFNTSPKIHLTKVRVSPKVRITRSMHTSTLLFLHSSRKLVRALPCFLNKHFSNVGSQKPSCTPVRDVSGRGPLVHCLFWVKLHSENRQTGRWLSLNCGDKPSPSLVNTGRERLVPKDAPELGVRPQHFRGKPHTVGVVR